MHVIKKLAASAALVTAVMAATAPVQASSVEVTVNAFDDIYGAFNGQILFGSTGSAATYSWNTAGFFWSGNIELTNSAGAVLYDINTNADDLYTLYAPGSGDALLGTLCVGGGSVACVVIQDNIPISLYATINSLNGGQGVCCDFNGVTPTVTAAAASTPLPAALPLFATGLGALGLLGWRRKRKAQAAA